ncbi:MAG TPA: citramalate synthase [Candidatus Limnocylindrales bacterium]|nr:citramalate synthase [Candidatus Limnocylindrales bacterium]
MKPEIEIYDTTLRDGSQGEGINFSVIDKLRIAEKLDAFGVHYIEGGWPGSNPKDIEFFAEAKRKKFRNARLAAFGSTRRKGTPVERDDQVRLLLEAETPVITIYGKSWLLHVKEVLRATPDENLGMIADTIRFLKDHGRYVIYDAEHAFDGYKHDSEYALATWQAAERGGADLIVLCDTNGGALPSEISRITEKARRTLTIKLGIHTHNDIGLGVANALAGLEAGAMHVQGTINGYGERTGNCNLTSVIPTLALKVGKRCLPDSALRKLKEVSQFVDEIANIRHDPRQPWVGEAAFAHKGGTHVNAVQKVVQSYEHIDPARIGNARRVLVSDLAGRSNIVMKAQELGFDLGNDTPELREILSRIKKLEHEGYEFEAAEGSLALVIRKILKHQEAPFKIEGFHVSIRRDRSIAVCQASVKVLVDGVTEHTIAEGDGPVNALDQALRNALVKFYPQLKKVRLADYKVRILDSASGTSARTRVLIESTDGKEEWGTVGVHDNIIEASLQALSDSLEYRLMKK